MGKFSYRRKKKRFAEISKFEALFLIIVGLLLGTVFTFGMHYWQSPIPKEEAIHVEATLSSIHENYGRHGLNEIIVRFEDHEQLCIKSPCLSSSVVQQVEALKPGSRLNLYAHPNSDTILELSYQGKIILAFDDAVKKLSWEVSAFTFLGAFLYLTAAFGAIKIIRKEVF